MQELLPAYRAFIRIAQLKSFNLAAESLGLSNTYVSTLVRQLEQQLGCRLLARTTRRVQLTSDGQLFYPRCLDLLAELDDLNQLFMQQQGEITGRLRIDLPTGIARHYLFPALPQVLAQHPKLELDISSTDRKVDIVAEGFDLVLRVGSVDNDGLVARKIGVAPMAIAASPAYIARHGEPKTLAELAGHQQVHYVRHFGGHDLGIAYLQSGDIRYVTLPGSVSVNHTDSYQIACLQGIGIIQSPRLGLARHFANGELIELMPALTQPSMPVWLLYPHRRHLTPRLQWALEWLQDLISPHLSHD